MRCRANPTLKRRTSVAARAKLPSCFTGNTSKTQGSDPRELRSKSALRSRKLTEPCHADVLLELANRD